MASATGLRECIRTSMHGSERWSCGAAMLPLPPGTGGFADGIEAIKLILLAF